MNILLKITTYSNGEWEGYKNTHPTMTWATCLPYTYTGLVSTLKSQLFNSQVNSELTASANWNDWLEASIIFLKKGDALN